MGFLIGGQDARHVFWLDADHADLGEQSDSGDAHEVPRGCFDRTSPARGSKDEHFHKFILKARYAPTKAIR
ncbi:hypothetical protein GCM10023156_09000 [Novipirellula rosea]|uniref:Uncharacterized protein n=1 Tax=Novipirellula rosea TaxID=1031540 RepID=A0ABP8MA91_9BACT